MERTPSNLHIGIVLLLERYPDRALLEQRLAEQTLRFPRLRQCLVDGTQPRLEEDAAFAVARHIRHLAPIVLPPDATAATAKERLLAAIAAAFVDPFDRGHPLWRIDVVGCAPVAGGPEAAALHLVMHHAAADGIGMAELLLALRDAGPAPDAWPNASDTDGEGITIGWLGVRDRLRMLRQMTTDMLRPCHRSALTGTLGTTREFTAWEFPRDALRRICHRFGCSLPAALLAITSEALRRYQQSHGYATSRDLSVFLPMSTRTRAERYALGNRFVTFRVPLSIRIDDPERRLERCRAEMQRAAALYPLRMSERVARRIARLPRSWQRRLADSPGRLTNLVFTLLPVKLRDATIAGARVTGSYGVPALLGVQGAALALLTDSKIVCCQLVTDPQIVSDPQRLQNDFSDSLAEYLCYCPVR